MTKKSIKNYVDMKVQEMYELTVKEWLIQSANKNISMGQLARDIGSTASAISRRAKKYGVLFNTRNTKTLKPKQPKNKGTSDITAENILTVSWGAR